MILQCRGVDDPTLPLDQQLRPETCWTLGAPQRSPARRRRRGRRGATTSTPTDADSGRRVRARRRSRAGVPRRDPTPSRPTSPRSWPPTARSTPACDARRRCRPRRRSAPPSRPPRSRPSPTSTATGQVQFEVRTDVENESLGCNDKVACSIVVIPIEGISCARRSDPRRACRRAASSSRARATSPTRASTRPSRRLLWWSASNWRNRFSIPITFGLPPDACDVLDDRAADRLLRLRADGPGRRCSGRRRTAWTRSGSSSSTTRCPTRPAST